MERLEVLNRIRDGENERTELELSIGNGKAIRRAIGPRCEMLSA